MAFKTAAKNAYKLGLVQAAPILLVPIGLLKVTIPDQFMGDIMGDINKLRGQVLGMNAADGGMQTIDAYVPIAELHSYAINLRSITRGTGSFTLAFERYDEVPLGIAEKIISEAKAEMVDDED